MSKHRFDLISFGLHTRKCVGVLNGESQKEDKISDASKKTAKTKNNGYAEEAQQEDSQKKLEQDLKEAQDQHLRAQAELENLRKRSARELENAHKYGIERFAKEVLEVKDNIEMGIESLKQQKDSSKHLEGMQLTLNTLTQTLERFAVTELDPDGEAFDPEQHEAMSAQESSKHPPNTVILVIKKGYLLHDRLLRPAIVIISKNQDNTAD